MPPDVSTAADHPAQESRPARHTGGAPGWHSTPAPRMIQLRLAPVAEPRLLNGGRGARRRSSLISKPEVGGWPGFFGKLLGKIPPDSRVWIVTQEALMFVRFDGPLYTGPVLAYRPGQSRAGREQVAPRDRPGCKRPARPRSPSPVRVQRSCNPATGVHHASCRRCRHPNALRGALLAISACSKSALLLDVGTTACGRAPRRLPPNPQQMKYRLRRLLGA